MIYVFDTSSLRSLQHFYPRVFKSIWNGLDELVVQRNLVSTREVFNELERQAISEAVLQWAKDNKSLFSTPTPHELHFATLTACLHIRIMGVLEHSIRQD